MMAKVWSYLGALEYLYISKLTCKYLFKQLGSFALCRYPEGSEQAVSARQYIRKTENKLYVVRRSKNSLVNEEGKVFSFV